MADEILFEGGDVLTGETIGKALARTGYSNYVSDGIAVTADYSAAVCDISSGKVYLIQSGRDRTLLPDARAGKPIATDGVNHLFITITETTQSDGSTQLGIEYVVNSDGTDPGGASLKVAEIDMGAQNVTPVNRFEPGSDNDAETYKGQDIDSDGDGTVDAADTANSVAGSDVDGAVAEADHAAAADQATSADTAASTGALGSSGGTASFTSDVDGGGNEISNLARATATRVEVDDSGYGFIMGAETSENRVWLAPSMPDVTRFGREFSYDDDGGQYLFETDVNLQGNRLSDAEVPEAEQAAALASDGPPAQINNNTDVNYNILRKVGNIELRSISGDDAGIDFGVDEPSEGSYITVFTPHLPSGDQTNAELKFNHSNPQWTFEAPLIQNGAWGSIPTRTTDPSGAPVGAEWYREDLG